jgi:hypothetical protein
VRRAPGDGEGAQLDVELEHAPIQPGERHRLAGQDVPYAFHI